MTTDDAGFDEAVETGAPDAPCAKCGHDGARHRLREVELPGATMHDTYCEDCEAPCEFVPRQDL
ncbi:MAG: hypothetical protein AB7F65_09970 [Dehalococcoidia bacterium]